MKINSRRIIRVLLSITIAIVGLMTGIGFASADKLIPKGSYIDPITKTTDIDGDGKGDLVLYDSTLAKFYVRYSNSRRIGSVSLGAVGDMPVLGDFNGDGQADLGTFNRTTAKWTIRITGGSVRKFTLGDRGSYPVAADYSGAGCTQPAAYNPRLGKFKIGDCNGANQTTVAFGGSNGGRIAVPMDYDCDGEADLAVYTPYQSQWKIKFSESGETQVFTFGQAGDIPIPGGYNDDAGCPRPAVYRSSTGHFYVLDRVNGSNAGISYPGVKLGQYGDRPVLANLNDNSKTDFVVYRPAEKAFYVKGATKPIVFNYNTPQSASSLPVAPIAVSQLYGLNYYIKGDYDRDGMADLATAERATDSTLFKIRYRNSLTTERKVTVGAKGDAIVVGDYDGDGAVQPAVVTVIDANTLRWTIKRNLSSDINTDWGINGDRPFAGDMDCDGKSDLLVARVTDGAFHWFVKLSSGGLIADSIFGLSTDSPYIADVDGDNCDELVVSRVGSSGIDWYYRGIYESSAVYLRWGLTTDTPITPADVNGDGVADFLVDRPYLGLHKVRGRLSRPEDNNASTTSYGLKNLSFGFETDVLMTGKFDGSGPAQLAVFRPSESPVGFYLNKLGRLLMFVAHGGNTDVLIRADGTIAEPTRSSSPTGCEATPGTPEDFYDGAGGSLWKPEAEGGSAPGKPTILLSSSYVGASLSILSSNGEDINAGIMYRGSYLPEYGRCAWDVGGYTAGQLEEFAPITVKIVRRDGKTECRVVESPESRND